MEIYRTTDTTISPRTREELLKRKSLLYHNTQRELRRPLGIYNLSLNNIWRTFEEVLNNLDRVMEKQSFRAVPPDSTWDALLVSRQEELISRIMRHFDDCLSILCCFFPYTFDKAGRQVSREVDRKRIMQELPVKRAMANVKQWRQHIAQMMNHMKHYQGMIRGIVLFNEENAIPGYFIEHVSSDEAIEPHPEVHIRFKGMHTAFSFNRDLRYMFVLVYAVSEAVADAIVSISPETDEFSFDSSSDEKLLSIIRRISNLPKYMFADEIHKDFPEVAWTEINGITHLNLEFPSTKTILPSLSGKQKVVLGFVGDGTSRTFAMPYYNT